MLLVGSHLYSNLGLLNMEYKPIIPILHPSFTLLWLTFLPFAVHLSSLIPSGTWSAFWGVVVPESGRRSRSPGPAVGLHQSLQLLRRKCIPAEKLSNWKKIMTKVLLEGLGDLDLISFHKPKATFLNQRLTQSASLSSAVRHRSSLFNRTVTPLAPLNNF